MKRKVLWMLLSFLLVASLVLASCAKEEVVGEEEEEEEEEEEVVGEEEEEPAVGVPQYGGTLTVYRASGDVVFTDMAHPAGGPVTYLAGPIIDYLQMGDFEKYGPRGTNEFPFNIGAISTVPKEFLRGALAESWELHWPDRVVFHIRPGVYWAAYGKEDIMEVRELTADDVAFSMTRAYDDYFPWMYTENGGFIDRVYAEDNYTYVVETSAFHVHWARWLSGHALGVYAPEVIEAGLDDWDELVGTGPFMFKEYVVGSYMTYERNPNFWGSPITINGTEYEIPFVDELIYAIIKDESTRVAALRTGKLEIYHKVDLKYEDTLAQTNPELAILHTLSDTPNVLALRSDIEPFNNKAVRRAMMIALDLEAIVKAVFIKGVATPWPLFPGFLAGQVPLEVYSASNRELLEYNPDLAKDMLAKAGHPNGFKVAAIVSAEDSAGIEILAMASSYWAAIGVELEIKVLEPVTLSSVQRAGEGWEVMAGSTPNRMPMQAPEKLYSGFIPGYNNAYYSNPVLDEWFSEVRATSDPVEQDAGFTELNKWVLDEVAYIPVGAPYQVTYWWPWIKNYYGEHTTTQDAASFVEASTWIDQDLKAEMGY